MTKGKGGGQNKQEKPLQDERNVGQREKEVKNDSIKMPWTTQSLVKYYKVLVRWSHPIKSLLSIITFICKILLHSFQTIKKQGEGKLGDAGVATGENEDPKKDGNKLNPMSEGQTTWRRTRRKVLMLGILFSSIRSRRAFSWLLQYSPYTENLSLCTTRNKSWPVSLSVCLSEEETQSDITLCLLSVEYWIDD